MISDLKSTLIQLIKGILRPFLTKNEARIAKVDVLEQNIQNTKLVVNRSRLLDLLPKNGVVAEIGVANGDFSAEILQSTSPQKLHLIDFWGSSRYNTVLKKNVYDRFETELSNGTVEVNLGLSTDLANTFANNYFDWIYIDTDHSYETTKKELALYAPKMKANGIIAGHDFAMGYWVGMNRYGVMEAVYEFCVANDWEILYITSEITNNPSFALRKIAI